MIKVVINKCYGGFSLSPKAVKRLQELRGEPCYFFKQKDIYPPSPYEPITVEEAAGVFMWHAFKVPNPNEALPSFEGWEELSLEDRAARNEAWSAMDVDKREIARDDPLLIQVIEELGDEANGQCAELAIAEIPDNVEWAVEEYDGMEWVAEAHRTWY